VTSGPGASKLVLREAEEVAAARSERKGSGVQASHDRLHVWDRLVSLHVVMFWRELDPYPSPRESAPGDRLSRASRCRAVATWMVPTGMTNHVHASRPSRRSSRRSRRWRVPNLSRVQRAHRDWQDDRGHRHVPRPLREARDTTISSCSGTSTGRSSPSITTTTSKARSLWHTRRTATRSSGTRTTLRNCRRTFQQV
jgi:hypothetical protein